MLKLLALTTLIFTLPIGAQSRRYIDHYESLYANKVTISNYAEFKQTLINHHFTEEKWILIVLRMNGMTLKEVQELKTPREISLPARKKKVEEVQPEPVPAPAPVLEPIPEPAPVVKPEVVEKAPVKIKRVRKKKAHTPKPPQPSKYSYFIQSSAGQVSVTGNDELNSKFDLIFFKIGLGVVRKMNGYSLKLGAAMNNYLSVDYTSDFGSEKSNEINDYYDVFLGGMWTKGQHNFTIQYDNLNYLINQEDQTEVSLEPTRVDRLSFSDSYVFAEKYFVVGSLGYFPDISSGATGYEYGIGLGRKFSSSFSLSTHLLQNQISKSSIKNQATILMLGLNYQF